MRLLLLTHYYAPEVGPPQLRWSALVRDLTAAGHQVRVIAPLPHYPSGRLLEGYAAVRPGAVELGEHGERVHRVSFRPTTGAAASALVDQLVAAGHTVLTAWRHRAELRPDVVVATAPGLPTLVAGRAVATLLRRPLVVEMRDAWPDLLRPAARTRSRSPRRWLRSAVVTGAALVVTGLQRSADVVVTTSASFTQELRSRRVGAVVTVRNAPRSLPALPAPDRVGTEVEGELRIVYVGTTGRAQRLETALHALREVLDAGVPARLRVVGAGARLVTARALARELDLPVDFVGVVPREQIVEHYAWSSTFLVILRDWPALHFAVPSKLYEALALGLHVSCSASGESEEIVRSTGAGLTAPAGDAHALAQAWIQHARDPCAPDTAAMRAWLEEHATEDIAARRYAAALEQVVARG